MNKNESTFEDSLISSYESIFVARQPIFDSSLNIWGYEFLFRNSKEDNSAYISDQDKATSHVIIDGFSAAQKGIQPETKILINFPRNAILEGIAYALPSEQVIIELLENVLPERQVLKKCLEHKKKGFQLALDDFYGHPEHEAFLKLVDIVKVDVLNLTDTAIAKTIKKLRHFSCTVIAEKVENKEMFELTKKLGCDYFQGFFFSKPEIIPGKAIQSNQTVKLRLLNALNHQEDYDPQKLSELIQTDISLSYRLLKFINSPGIGLPNKISSIRHAITLLGYKRIFHWIRVLVLADLNSSPKGEELTFRSAQRGRFLQLLTEGMNTLFDTEGMFLLGLFSLLDSILDQPMEEIIKHLPLEETLANTLLGKRTQASVWLDLVEAQERADWDKVQEMIQDLNLIPEYTAACYVQALNWANDLLYSTESTEEDDDEDT